MKFLWKYSALFCTLLTASHHACAQAMFAGYAQFCGVPVIAAPNPHIASAAIDPSGKPVIFIDPGALSNWTAPTIFMIAHECAHHKQGHILPDGMKFRKKTFSGTKQQELEADCWAAGQLADIMAIQDLHRVIVYFFSQGSRPQGNYPTGMERAAMVVRCAEIQAQPVSACTTPYGSCPLRTYLPAGTPCNCPSPTGPVRGFAE